MKLFWWCIPVRKSRRISKESLSDSSASSAASENASPGSPNADWNQSGLYDSVLAHVSSVTAWSDEPASPMQHAVFRQSTYGSNRSSRISYSKGQVIEDGFEDNILLSGLDVDSAVKLIRKLTRALEVTSRELKRTELELRDCIVEIAELKSSKTCCTLPSLTLPLDTKTNRRRGSCPSSTLSVDALPSCSVFSVINKVVRQDSC
jgi:hypothetical protein